MGIKPKIPLTRLKMDKTMRKILKLTVSDPEWTGQHKMSCDFKHYFGTFCFSHEKPELFRVSQWGDLSRVSKCYLGFRVILAAAYASTYIVLWILDSTELKSTWLIYLTNQSMLLLVLHLLLEMLLAIKTYKRQMKGHSLR